jgi:hypothetical protein
MVQGVWQWSSEIKKWLRAQDAFFFYEGLNKLMYRYDKCLNRLGDYVEKWS